MRLSVLFTALAVLFASASAFAADTLKDVFANGTLKGEVRNYYFARDFDENTPDRADMAVGTLFYYKTAPLYGISAGFAFASSSDIYSDDDKAVYGLLQRDSDGNHQSYTRLQEYYIQGEWFNTRVKYGAQQINTPFMNTHDIRMMPKSYEGFSIVNNSIKNLELSAYYITGYMGWTDDEAMDIVNSVNAAEDDDKALIVAGLKYTLPIEAAKITAQGWHYNMEDVFSSNYVQVSASKKAGDFNLYFNPSGLIQKSKGDDLGGNFDTDQYGFNTGFAAYGFDVTGFYAKTGDDDLFVPWGDGKVIIQQVLAAGRAEEDAYALKVGYDFSKVGIKGLSAYAFHTVYDTPESGNNASADMSETDLSAQYGFGGALDGLSLRVRYAMINVDDGEDYNDFRIYIKYNFALGSNK